MAFGSDDRGRCRLRRSPASHLDFFGRGMRAFMPERRAALKSTAARGVDYNAR